MLLSVRMSIYMYIAAAAWLLLLAALLCRKKRRVHVPLAVSGIMLDATLVAYLQYARSAVQTALSFSLTPLNQIHIGCSTIALLLYLPVLWLGILLLCCGRSGRLRRWHIRFASSAFFFRTLGFIFMFSLIK